MLRCALLPLIPLASLAAEPFFPVSVWYGGGKVRAPMLDRDPHSKREAWRQDVRQIRALGFNTIRCWIDWASGEPAEGKYNFDTLDVLLPLAEEAGLKVIVQVYMDSAPAWVGRKHPDALFVSSSGQSIQPESSPGYCRDHPAVARFDTAFYEALATRLNRSPAFLGFDLWSEPHVINWATPTYISNPEFCFCPNTLRRFRQWLQGKYPKLDALNQAWYRQYASWDEVEPNRLSTILSYTDYIDWKAFIVDKLGADLRSRYDAVKRRAPDRVATSHAAGVGLFATPHWWEGQSDDWTMARQVDYYGTSFYPKHSANVDRDPEWRGALLDFARSFGYSGKGRGFWMGELQAGFGTIALNVSKPVTAADLRNWMWSALARGAKALNIYAWYPMSTGYESGGFGLIELDGVVTDRAKEAGRIASLVDRHRALFATARPPKGQVAVLYNPLAHFVGGRQRAAVYGGPQGEAAGIERDSLLGIYRALFPASSEIDYVHADHLEELEAYRLVYAPYPLMISTRTAGRLKQYVEAGGTLISEARFGWNDERGRASEAIPGMGWHKVFQAREQSVQTKAGVRVRWDAGGALGLAEPLTIAGRGFQETLLAAGGEVVAKFEDGSPAAVLARYGKGRTLLVGSYISAAQQTSPDSQGRALFTALLKWAGVEPAISVSPPTMEARYLEAGGAQLVFLINHAEQPAQAAVKWRFSAASAADLESGERVSTDSITVAARGVRVLRIQ